MTVRIVIGDAERGTFDVSALLAGPVRLSTSRHTRPGVLRFALWRDGVVDFNEGASVTLTAEGKRMFAGRVFSKRRGKEQIITVTAYDRLRYFKNRDSHAFYGLTAGEILARLAEESGVPAAPVPDTGFPVSALVAEDRTRLDILEEALAETRIGTGRLFVAEDTDAGLTLFESSRRKSELLLDGESVLELDYRSSIDDGTITGVRLVSRREEGYTDALVLSDKGTEGRWGGLWHYEILPAAATAEGIALYGSRLMEARNRPFRTLTLRALGDLSVRGGCLVPVSLPKLGEIDVQTELLCEEAELLFENGRCFMELELQLIGEGEGTDWWKH